MEFLLTGDAGKFKINIASKDLFMMWKTGLVIASSYLRAGVTPQILVFYDLKLFFLERFVRKWHKSVVISGFIPRISRQRKTYIIFLSVQVRLMKLRHDLNIGLFFVDSFSTLLFFAKYQTLSYSKSQG